MVKHKGQGVGASAPATGELTNVEFDLQVHKDETSAKLNELQTTLNVYQDAFNSFRTEMMNELRSMKDSSAATAAHLDSSNLKFGSLPPTSGSPGLAARADSASSTRANTTKAILPTDGSISLPPHTLSLNPLNQEVPIAVTSEIPTETINASAALGSSRALVTNASGSLIPKPVDLDGGDKEEMSLHRSQVRAEQSQTFYYQHSNFGSKPFNHFAGPYVTPNSYQFFPSPQFHQIPSSNSLDPFTMTYSGPYSYTHMNFVNAPTQPPQSSTIQGYPSSYIPQSMGTAQPTFATSTTSMPHYSYTPYISQSHHTHTVAPSSPNQQPHGYPLRQFHQQVPHSFDPNLPTMKHLKLEFTFSVAGTRLSG